MTTTMQTIYLDTIDAALAQAPEAWRVEFDDCRLAFPGQADQTQVARLVLEAPDQLLAGYVCGLYIINTRH